MHPDSFIRLFTAVAVCFSPVMPDVSLFLWKSRDFSSIHQSGAGHSFFDGFWHVFPFVSRFPLQEFERFTLFLHKIPPHIDDFYMYVLFNTGDIRMPVPL